MGTAWTYSKDGGAGSCCDPHKSGFDGRFGTEEVHLVGPHSSAILNYATTRDVTKIYPGKSAYACMLNEARTLTSRIAFCTAPDPMRGCGARQWCGA